MNSWASRFKLLIVVGFMLAVAALGPAAYAAATESGADASATAELTPLESPQPEPDPVSKRLFDVIPNYRASQTLETYKPLTTAEKYHIAFMDSFDWPNYFLLAGYAAESQVASKGFSHNGGVAGFGKFYARSFSDQIIGSYVTEAILPSLLHEDPRYFRLGIGSFWCRTYYATSRIFVTRTDNGGTRLYLSELVGNVGVDAITTWYYPDSRSPSKGAERYAMQLGNDAISNLLTEYWPDIKRRLQNLRHHSVTP